MRDATLFSISSGSSLFAQTHISDNLQGQKIINAQTVIYESWVGKYCKGYIIILVSWKKVLLSYQNSFIS